MRWQKSALAISATITLLAAGCGGSSTEDPCRDISCNNPPANTCKNEDTLLEYPASGSCNPSSAKCDYSATEKKLAKAISTSEHLATLEHEFSALASHGIY